MDHQAGSLPETSTHRPQRSGQAVSKHLRALGGGAVLVCAPERASTGEHEVGRACSIAGGPGVGPENLDAAPHTQHRLQYLPVCLLEGKRVGQLNSKDGEEGR